MKMPAACFPWIWASVTLGVLTVAGPVTTASGQTGRPSNPLRGQATAASASAAGTATVSSNSVGSRSAASVAEPATLELPAPGKLRPVTYQNSPGSRTVGFVPKHERATAVRGTQLIEPTYPRNATQGATRMRIEPVELAPGERLVEGPVWEGGTEQYAIEGPGEFLGPGEVFEADEHPVHGVPLGSSGCCGDAACGSCCLPCPLISLHNLDLQVGVHGFTGPPNLGQTGSFGFDYGLNWGTPLPIGNLGAQVGVNIVQSNFNGAEFTTDTRNQVFLTAGVFRRVDCGLQGGLAIDYVRDDWYVEYDLTQLRGELSWVFPSCHELGVWFTTSTQSYTAEGVIFTGINNQMQVSSSVEPTDLFAFFYRRQLARTGGEGRFFAGFSGESDGLLGMDLRVPLSDRCTIQGGFTYLVPEQRADRLDHQDESWNVGMNLVWHLGPPSVCQWKYYRPLLKVADNGSFLIKRR
ncbi:MAG: hypothetical protein J5I93_22120 [Pirellulaceae bacterium]|nr:hypothetical protein [Pirellulaceae bacterium]